MVNKFSFFFDLVKCKVFLEALYGRMGLGTQGSMERSTVIAAISIIFIIYVFIL